ncbi:MAG: metallophosphoesterase [Syntrophorhabdales bacterium]|jgi:UDP-2,3-diacylglucosamine hydrolase
MKAVFFSDAHLPDNDAGRVRVVKTFLRHVAEDADIVVVLGDLFEFYHGYDDYIYPFYREVVDALADAALSKSVYFIEGNHEYRMGPYFESYTGIRCVRSLSLDLDGKHVFLCHGDAFRAFSLSRLLRSSLVYSIMDLLGPDRTWRIAMRCGRVLSKKRKIYDEGVRARFRRYGKKKLREGYDAVIIAHSHIADFESYDMDGRKKIYMNTGDIVASGTYGSYISGEGFALRTMSDE